jgi:hypothetical protein
MKEEAMTKTATCLHCGGPLTYKGCTHAECPKCGTNGERHVPAEPELKQVAVYSGKGYAHRTSPSHPEQTPEIIWTARCPVRDVQGRAHPTPGGALDELRDAIKGINKSKARKRKAQSKAATRLKAVGRLPCTRPAVNVLTSDLQPAMETGHRTCAVSGCSAPSRHAVIVNPLCSKHWDECANGSWRSRQEYIAVMRGVMTNEELDQVRGRCDKAGS